MTFRCLSPSCRLRLFLSLQRYGDKSSWWPPAARRDQILIQTPQGGITAWWELILLRRRVYRENVSSSAPFHWRWVCWQKIKWSSSFKGKILTRNTSEGVTMEGQGERNELELTVSYLGQEGECNLESGKRSTHGHSYVRDLTINLLKRSPPDSPNHCALRLQFHTSLTQF